MHGDPPKAACVVTGVVEVPWECRGTFLVSLPGKSDV